MKKWLIALCCVLIAGVVASVTLLNNRNGQIDTLNKDLGDIQAEYNSLKEKSENDEKTIADLNQQVENLTAENGQLTAANGQLNETLETLNRNLSSSQEKLQGVMYILTDGAQGSIDSLLSPYLKIFEDAPLDSPYFEAVNYVCEHQLMNPLGEAVFGVTEKATLGELADGLYRLGGKTGGQEEAVSALLSAEQAWLAAQSPAEDAAPAADAPAEETEAAPAAEEEPAAAEKEAAKEEAPTPADEAAAETAPEAAAESPAEASEPETETAEETATEEAPAPEGGAETPDVESEVVTAAEAEAPAAEAEDAEKAEAAPAEEPAEPETAEAGEEVAEADTPAETAADSGEAAPAEDAATILTRTRLLTLCQAFCAEAGKDCPEILLPESGGEEALRGDLAMALLKLAAAE
ncbi:MAG: hypothetical protein IJ231_10365 [Clostridia bacterium]|nr:hypothetical protein [Clostridia bacterium]